MVSRDLYGYLNHSLGDDEPQEQQFSVAGFEASKADYGSGAARSSGERVEYRAPAGNQVVPFKVDIDRTLQPPFWEAFAFEDRK